MIIAQLTDSHLRVGGKPLKGLVDSEAALAACIAGLNRFDPRPDAVLATGDLVDKARRKNYRALRRALDELEMPVYVIPGNNDDRARMREAFADRGYLPQNGEFLHYTVEDHPLRLIGLDTMTPDGPGGEMCPRRLKWLEARLAAQPGRPTVLFMHHPPFATGLECIDHHPFIGAANLERLVRRHPNIEHLVCGHAHRQVTVRWAATVATTAPSIAFQTELVLRRGAPSTNVVEPVFLPIFQWTPENGLIGHISMIRSMIREPG